jgi:hypothetical protein
LPDWAKSGIGTIIVSGLDGIITSLYSDSFKTPPPTQQEMIENACITAGISIVTKLMSTTFKQEMNIEARLTAEEGLKAFFRSLITILVGFEGRALAGILNCMIPE